MPAPELVTNAATPGSDRRFGGWLAAAIAVTIALLGVIGLTPPPAGAPQTGGGPLPDADPTAVVSGFDGGLSGPKWSVVAGTWTVDGPEAALVEPPPRPTAPSIVVTDVGGADGWVAAVADDIAPGWGLIYRYADVANYSFVIANPGYASFQLVQIAAGERLVLGTVAPAPTRSGAVVRVDAVGSRVELRVDGKVVLTVSDAAPEAGTFVGLYAAPSAAGTARWGSFGAGMVGS